jgi:hypothetical protein
LRFSEVQGATTDTDIRFRLRFDRWALRPPEAVGF